MERVHEIERIIRTARDYQGQSTLSDDTLFRQAVAWESLLLHIPVESLWDCYQYAQKTRQNAGSMLNPQNLMQAHREMVQQGRVVTLAPERTKSDPRCPDCRGIGYTFRAEPRTRDILADDDAAIVYTVAVKCECREGMFAAPDQTQRIGKMMRWLAERHNGQIPNPDKQQIAAERLLEAGWSAQEILCCYEDLSVERGHPADWVAVWRYIGIRSARQHLAEIFARSDERRIEAEHRAAEMLAIAARPISLEEYQRERRRRESATAAAQAERDVQYEKELT